MLQFFNCCKNQIYDDVIEEMVLKLSYKDILNCKSVSQKWLKVISNKNFWHKLFMNHFGKLNQLWCECDYKEYYQKSYQLDIKDLLLWSIKNECVGLAKKILLNNKKIYYNNSILINLCAAKGFNEIIEILLKLGYNQVDDSSDEYASPLYMACQEGQIETVKFLIKHKANIEYKYKGFTPLFIASQKGYIDIVNHLIDCGAIINSLGRMGCTPFYVACQENKENVVELLYKNGAHIEALYDKNFTPLYVACRHGHVNIVNKLISYGANINMSSEDGSGCLCVASQHGYNKIVKLLLQQKNINLNINLLGGYTPLYSASQNGYNKVVKLLVQKYSHNIDYIAPNGVTALYIACQNGHEKVVSILLNYANYKITWNGISPLIVSLFKGHIGVIKLLLSKYTVDDKLIILNDLMTSYQRSNTVKSKGIELVVNHLMNNLHLTCQELQDYINNINNPIFKDVCLKMFFKV